MIKRQAGFTLIELMVTMVIFVLSIAAASNIFTELLTQFKQQSKIAETNIEGMIGLEMLRQDVEHGGYGLPAVIPAGIVYSEAVGLPASGYNDTPSNPPRAFVSGNDAGLNGSDYLAIKAINIAMNEASQLSTTLEAAPFIAPFNPRTWTPASENLQPTDEVIIIAPGLGGAEMNTLVTNGAAFYATYNDITNAPWPPTDATATRIVYGIKPASASAPARPFNRADYYVKTPAANFPSRCAIGTGILYKAITNHADGALSELPLLDCVADMQVVYGLDTTNDGNIDTNTGIISALTAQDIRDQLKEVRVYVLVHEGQRDPNFAYTTNPVTVGEFGAGSSFDFTAIPIVNWENYRWKVYTIVVRPTNLG